jgi:hypothetical protein
MSPRRAPRKQVGNQGPGGFSPALIAVDKVKDLVAYLLVNDPPPRRTAANSQAGSPMAAIFQLVESFHRVALSLRDRRKGRSPVKIKDEYDVQYLLAALLATRFEDIRAEEWTPSYAGSSSRVDFLLKNESVLVETKMTRAGLLDGKLGEELTLDIARYKQRDDCDALVCFVYDPENKIKNVAALENDLSKPTDGLDVRVFIRPKP